MQEPLPFSAPRRVPVGALTAFTVALGTAAVIGVGPLWSVPGWVVAFGAAVAGILGGLWIWLRAERKLSLFVPLIAPLILFGGFLGALLNPVVFFPYRDDLVWWECLVFTGLFAVPFTVVCAPLFVVLSRASRAPSHDLLDRVLVRLAVWLSLVVGVSMIFNQLLCGWLPALGAGGVTRASLILAFTGGAAMSVPVLLRDRGRLRWIARLMQGGLPGWSLLRRDEIRCSPPGQEPLIPYVAVASAAADGVIAARAIEGSTPFRAADTLAPAAWLPLDPSLFRRQLRRRAALAAVLALAHGAFAIALVVGWVQHRLPLTEVARVSAGTYHTCALMENGTVRCWGWNRAGELGDGTTQTSYAPVTVAGLHDVTALAAGTWGTCALRQGGTVACWGELGRGSTVARDLPGLSSIVRLAAGDGHACALRRDGRVLCWGKIDWANLATEAKRSDPTPMKMPSGGGEIVDLSAGRGWACIQRIDGVHCWARIGDEPRAVGRGPVPIVDGTWGPAGRIGRSWEHDCALDTRGKLLCEDRRTKAAVEIEGVKDFDVGEMHTCAVLTDGTVRCFGINRPDGQLGDGTAVDSKTPVVVLR